MVSKPPKAPRSRKLRTSSGEKTMSRSTDMLCEVNRRIFKELKKGFDGVFSCESVEALAGKENDAAAAAEGIHMQKANKYRCESGRRQIASFVRLPKSRYQRRTYVCCCIWPGEMERGGLATRIPVLGLTMGMALRVRRAEGWWIFRCWVW